MTGREVQLCATLGTVPSLPKNEINLLATSDSNEIYPDNTAVEFTNNLHIPFVSDQAYEIKVESLNSNWRISSFVVQENATLNVKICSMPVLLDYFTYNPTYIEPPTPPYNPGTVTYGGVGSSATMDPYNMRTATIGIELGNGLALYDHLQNWTLISAGIRQWLNTGNNLLNLLPDFAFEISNGFILPNLQVPTAQRTAQFCPLGNIVGGANGLLGLVGCGIYFITPWPAGQYNAGGILPPPESPLTVNYNLWTNRGGNFQAGRYGVGLGFGAGYYMWLMIDGISLNPFQVFKDNDAGGPQWTTNSGTAVKLSRLLGIPNDVYFPTNLFQWYMNQSFQTFESKLWYSEQSILQITQNGVGGDTLPLTWMAQPPTQFFSMISNSSNQQGYLLSQIQSFPVQGGSPPPWFAPPAGQLAVTLKASFFSKIIQIVQNDNYENEDFVGPVEPKINMKQEPSTGSPYSGVLLPLNMLYQATDNNTHDYRIYPTPKFYNLLNNARLINSQMIVAADPDFSLDCDFLTLLLVNDAIIGFNQVGGDAVKVLGIIPTLSSNAQGFSQQFQIQSPQSQFVTNQYYLNYLEANNVTAANITTATITETYPSVPCTDFMVQQFTPLFWNQTAEATNYNLLVSPNNDNSYYTLSFMILNEVNEVPQLLSFGGKLPWTHLKCKLTVYNFGDAIPQLPALPELSQLQALSQRRQVRTLRNTRHL